MNSLIAYILKNKKQIILFWIILILISILNIIFNNSSFESGIGEIDNSISQSVDKKLKTRFPEGLSGNLIITFTNEKYNFDTKLFSNSLNSFENLLKKQSEIKNTFSILNSSLPNMISEDKKTAVILLQLKDENFQLSEKYTQQLRELIKNFPKDRNTEIYVTGNAAFSYDMNSLSESQGKRAEFNVLVFTFLALVFAFNSVSSSLIAIISGFSASILTISLLKIITIYFNLSIFCQNVSTMLGLGLSIDYSLLLITRYRSELETNNKYDAIIKTMQTAGTSVLYSGITVLIGFIALFIPNLKLTSSIALGGTLVVLFSIIIALTFTIPILYIFTDKLNYPKILSDKKRFKSNISRKWAEFIMKHHISATLCALMILIIMSLPALNIKLSDPEIRTMPDNMEAKQGFKELQKVSDGDIMFPIFILAESKKGNITDSSNLISLNQYIELLKKNEKIREINSILTFKDDFRFIDYFTLFNSGISTPEFENLKKYLISDDNQLTLIQIFPDKNLKSYQVNELITELRELESKQLKIEVGGPASISHDLIEKLYSSYIYIVLSVYLITFILLAYVFKSILIPLKAIFVNTISLFASYGILVLIFQYNWGASLINLKYSPESLLSGIPIILFCIMFSLSMDYEVFLLSRIHEEYLKNHDNEASIIIGLTETGGVITKAAMVMIIVFGAFTQADIIIIKMLGTGLAIAVFIDATLIRMIIVPGFLKLAGKLNWYYPFRFK